MVPSNLQSVLWSAKIDKMDLQKDKNYIIHQILAFGTWDQIQWLFSTYPLNTVRNVFEKYPTKDYVPASFNFAKNLLLNINKPLDQTLYVKTFPRRLR